MPRSTSTLWKEAMSRDATQEQALDLLTITAPVDRPEWSLRLVADNDYFHRDAGIAPVTGKPVTFNATTMRISTSGTFFDPSPPEDEYMSASAFFTFTRTSGPGDDSNDGEWQIKTIESPTSVIVFPRRTMTTVSNSIGTLTYRETFLPAHCKVKHHSETPDSVPSIDITIGFNDPSLISDIAALTEPPLVVAEVVLRSEPDFVQMQTSPMEWAVFQFGRNTITGSLSGPAALSKDVPHNNRTPFLRPGLFNLL